MVLLVFEMYIAPTCQMDGEGTGPSNQPKRATPLSTVSLDSSYDHDDEDSKLVEKQRLYRFDSWAPCVVFMGLVLAAVCLVLALNHGDIVYSRGALVEEGPAFSTVFSSSTNDQRLTAPQKKLREWLKQARNASQIDVEGGSSNMSISGIIFPQKDTDSSQPFDAFMTVYSGVLLPSRQYVALTNGRGYQWTVTSMSDGDSLATSGCFDTNQIIPFDGLDLVFMSANWTSSDDRTEVNVVFNGSKYRISQVEDNFYSSVDDTGCWLIESEDKDVNFSVCASDRDDLLPKSEFSEFLNASSECPQLRSKTIDSMGLWMPVVPLPLRKWYASYPGHLISSY